MLSLFLFFLISPCTFCLFAFLFIISFFLLFFSHYHLSGTFPFLTDCYQWQTANLLLKKFHCQLLVLIFWVTNTCYAAGSLPLPWPMRMKIALGAATGLAFLHEEAERPVIYRDFKTSNILLDAVCGSDSLIFMTLAFSSANCSCFLIIIIAGLQCETFWFWTCQRWSGWW